MGSPRLPKWSPREPKATKMEPKGAKMTPRGLQNNPKLKFLKSKSDLKKAVVTQRTNRTTLEKISEVGAVAGLGVAKWIYSQSTCQSTELGRD